MQNLLDTRRWLVLSAYWLAQAAILLALYALVVGSTTDDGSWEFQAPADYLHVLTDSGYGGTALLWLLILTALQFLLVLPVNLRILARKRGRSIKISLAAAAAFLALLVVAFFAAVCELVVVYELVEPRGWSWWAIGIGLALSWAFFTALLVRYANRSRLTNEDLLTRVARIVFAGTAVETAALIPVDIMIRRKTDCYCWSGSFWALVLSGAVGFVVAGPAIFLPLLARRPRRLRAGLCQWCGYSRAGLSPDAPCPECGTTPGAP